MRKSRLSRRRFLAGTAALAGAGLAAACGGGEKTEDKTPVSTPGTSDGQPKRGGIIRMATTAPALSLDPHTDTTLGAAAAPYMYGHTVMPTDWGDLLYGDLAEKWEVVDEINWTFHIRPGVRFHNLPPVNGREAVAGDIVYSYKRLESLPGGALTGWSEWIDRYEAPEDRILSVHTRKPYSYIFMSLGSPRLAVVPREAVEQFGDLKSNAIGTGPFILKNWGQSQGIEVERNPDYYDPDLPYLDGLKWSTMSDDSAIQAAFRSGAADLYGAPDKVRAESVTSVKGVTAQRYLNRLYTVLMMNASRFPAFADVRVREAVDISLDRQAMIDKLHLGDGELSGPVGPSWTSALPPEEIRQAYKRDVAKARQLLTAAGQENLHFSLACSNYQDNADRAAIIQQNLAEAGIKADIDVRELGTWLDDLYAVNYETTTFAHLAYLSDDIQLQSHYSTGFNRAMSLGITDPEVDALLQQVQSTIDETARIQVALEAQRKILERHGPTLVLYEPYGYLVAYDYIKGYEASPWVFGLYKFDMWLDKG
jgi:peptide/nickel transport system substrate-binding protein